MSTNEVSPKEWLSDGFLTDAGRDLRAGYRQYCDYLDSLGLLSFQVARTKYFMQSWNKAALPGGYALPPHTINVCVNNRCNLKCRYCDFGQGAQDTFYYKYNVVDGGSKIDMPIETCKSIVDQASWFKPIIRASFREPLLYPHILEFVEYTKSKAMPFWLLTNGLKLPQMAQDLVTLGVDSVRLSLDGPPAVHDSVRGLKGAYRRMMDGVKLLIEQIKRQGKRTQVGFYFTLNDENFDSMTAVVEELDREGVLKDVFLSFQWLLYTTEELARRHNETDGPICGGLVEESTVLNVDMSKIDIAALSRQRDEIMARFPADQGYRIHFRPSFDEADLNRYLHTVDFPVENPQCKTMWYNLNINPAGDVKSFHHCLLPGVGNIFEQGLMDIWNSDEARRQRTLLNDRGAFAGCARCWGVYALLEDRRRKD